MTLLQWIRRQHTEDSNHMLEYNSRVTTEIAAWTSSVAQCGSKRTQSAQSVEGAAKKAVAKLFKLGGELRYLASVLNID